MILIFPIFALSDCILKETSSDEYYFGILNITNFVDCSYSDRFDDHRMVQAVSYSKTDSTFENENMLLFSSFMYVDTVMFEGNVELLKSTAIQFRSLAKVIFYRNLYEIEHLAFEIPAVYYPPIIYYYGSVVPKYSGEFLTDYPMIEIHVSDDYPADDFHGHDIKRDLGSGYVLPQTPLITPLTTPLRTLSTTPLITPSTTPLITLSTTPLSTPSTTPDSTPSSSYLNGQNPDENDDLSKGDNDEPKKSNEITIIIVVVTVFVVLLIIVIIVLVIYLRKHPNYEESFDPDDINTDEINLEQNQLIIQEQFPNEENDEEYIRKNIG